jgi:hypothetical protein
MKPLLKAPGTVLLKLWYGEPLSFFAIYPRLRRYMKAMKLMGYKYIGFEVGHVSRCAYNAPQHADSYGV